MKNLSYILFFFISFQFVSCSSIQSTYDNGSYNDVIQQVLQKEKNNSATDSDIQLLENAFDNLKTETYAKIDVLNESNADDKWERMIAELNELNSLKEKMQQQAPLTSKNGKVATINFDEIDEMQADLVNEATTCLEVEANRLNSIAIKYPKSLNEKERATSLYKRIEKLNPAKDYSEMY